MQVRDLVSIVERSHREHAGVPVSLVERYIEALDDRGGSVGAARFTSTFDDRRTDSSSWVGPDAVYEVGDDHVSAFPSVWHDQLGPEDDLPAFVEVIRTDVDDTNEAFDVGGAGYGVPKSVLVEAAMVLAGVDPTEAEAALDGFRREGVFDVDADQHPHARVQFTEAARPDALSPEQGSS